MITNSDKHELDFKGKVEGKRQRMDDVTRKGIEMSDIDCQKKKKP